MTGFSFHPLTSFFFFSPQMPKPKQQVQQRRVRNMGTSTNIPSFRQYPIITQTFEFDGSAGTYNITAQNLRNLIFVPNTTTAGVSLADTFRIRCVEVWGTQASTAVTFGDVQLEWAGSSVPVPYKSLPARPLLFPMSALFLPRTRSWHCSKLNLIPAICSQ